MNFIFKIKESVVVLTKKLFKPQFYFCKFQIAKMGLLSEGNPLSWEETKALAEHVRQHGIEQFINLYAKLRERTGDVLKWGDEVCYFLYLL